MLDCTAAESFSWLPVRSALSKVRRHALGEPSGTWLDMFNGSRAPIGPSVPDAACNSAIRYFDLDQDRQYGPATTLRTWNRDAAAFTSWLH
jgi:hypothetical protein